MTLDRPGADPAGAARRLFAYVKDAGYPVRWLAGDLLYTDQKPEKYQTAAKEIGYKPGLEYGPKHHGRQGSHKTGMLLVEGSYVCPAMPVALIDATVNRRSKDTAIKTTHEQWQADIEARTLYLMRPKDTPDKNGKERLGCPASGANPIAVCSHKPKSSQYRATKQADGTRKDTRKTIFPTSDVLTDGALPTVCAQDTITLHRADGDESAARYRQELRFGTVQHQTVYVRLRQAQQGVHGFAKKQAVKALSDLDSRRVRGKAAQSLFAALLFAAASIAKIRAFLGAAKKDPETGDRYVIRQPLVSALRTPPGDAPPDRPPDEPPLEEVPPPPEVAHADLRN